MPYRDMQGVAPGQAVVTLASQLTVPFGRGCWAGSSTAWAEPLDGGRSLAALPRRAPGRRRAGGPDPPPHRRSPEHGRSAPSTAW